MKRTSLLVWVGSGISVLFVVLLLRKIDGEQLVSALRRLDLRYLGAAVLLTFVSYWLRAVRWRLLLLHERRLPLRSLYSAVIVGYMANNLFPARFGEFVRAWLVSEREQIKLSSVFASLLIDRLVDGLSVMVILAGVLVALQLPPGMEQVTVVLRTGGMTTLTVYLAVVGILLLLKLRPVRTLGLLAHLLRPFPQGVSERFIPWVGSFLEGVRLAPDMRHLLLIGGCSALIWITATLPIDLVLRGFGIHLPLTASFFIMVLLVFAVMVPAAPGYIGTYHLACYTGLSAFRLPDTQAVSIALIVHGVGFFPVILAGLYHLWSDGISFCRLRLQASDERGAQ